MSIISIAMQTVQDISQCKYFGAELLDGAIQSNLKRLKQTVPEEDMPKLKRCVHELLKTTLTNRYGYSVKTDELLMSYPDWK